MVVFDSSIEASLLFGSLEEEAVEFSLEHFRVFHVQGVKLNELAKQNGLIL